MMKSRENNIKLQIGDIFYLDVAYTEDPSKWSNRPVLILDELEGDVLLLVSTTTKERNYPFKEHDQYKIPILNWEKAGLAEPSWCRGKVLIRLPRKEVESLVKPGDYIGRILPGDFNRIVDEVEKIHL